MTKILSALLLLLSISSILNANPFPVYIAGVVDEYGAEVRVLEDTCSCKIGVGHARVIDIVSDTSDYQFLLNNLDFLTFYINRIKNDYSMEDMQKLVDIVEEQEMEVIVELGGVLGPGWGSLTDIDNGKNSALVEIKNSLNWIRAGGKIDYVIFDGPIRRLLYGDIKKNLSDNNGVLVSGHFNTTRGPYSYEEAADEILYCMAEWRKVYPEIKFILGCNFPNWGWKGQQDYHKRQADGMNWGDYWEVVQVVMNKVQSSATPFNAMIIDWPYNYAVGEKYSSTPGNDPTAIDWIARILELEEYVKGLGLEFYLYTNIEEQESNVVYSEGTLKYVDLYRQRGGAPDGWNVQSWYPVPTSFGPENQQYSMSWLTNEVIKKLRNLDITGLEGKRIPDRVLLYPNPTRGQFTLRFHSAEPGQVTIKLIDINGRLINTDLHHIGVPGTHEYTGSTAGLATGIYNIRLETLTSVATRKLIVK